MDSIEVFKLILDAGYAVVLAVVVMTFAKLLTPAIELMKTANEQQARANDKAQQVLETDIKDERDARLALEHRLNAQRDEQEKLKEQIKMLLDEIKDKELKIANLVLLLKERDDLLAKTQRELDEVRQNTQKELERVRQLMKTEVDVVRESLQRELDQVRKERDELAARLRVVEEQQKDGANKNAQKGRRVNGK